MSQWRVTSAWMACWSHLFALPPPIPCFPFLPLLPEPGPHEWFRAGSRAAGPWLLRGGDVILHGRPAASHSLAGAAVCRGGPLVRLRAGPYLPQPLLPGSCHLQGHAAQRGGPPVCRRLSYEDIIQCAAAQRHLLGGLLPRRAKHAQPEDGAQACGQVPPRGEVL